MKSLKKKKKKKKKKNYQSSIVLAVNQSTLFLALNINLYIPNETMILEFFYFHWSWKKIHKKNLLLFNKENSN